MAFADRRKRGTGILIAGCLLLVDAAAAAPAFAQNTATTRIDRAGGALNAAIGRMLGAGKSAAGANSKAKPAPAPAAVPAAATPDAATVATVPLPPPRPASASARSGTAPLAQAATVPLPTPKPAPAAKPNAGPVLAALPPDSQMPASQMPAARTPAPSAPPPAASSGAQSEPLCAQLVADGIAIAAPAPAPTATPDAACGIEGPVRLAAVRLAGGGVVALEPVALLRCDMAAAVARWIRDDAAPVVAGLGAPVEAVRVAASYDCRPRNRVEGAKLSEHGRGNAIDIAGFALEDGRSFGAVGPGAGDLPGGLQTKLRQSACARFKTILGPGSDGYHEEHLHLDLAPRRSGAVLCEWDIPEQTAH